MVLSSGTAIILGISSWMKFMLCALKNFNRTPPPALTLSYHDAMPPLYSGQHKSCI
jgi:hypothetical protein